MGKRQTAEERARIKLELRDLFDKWNKMTDDELRAEVQQRFTVPVTSGTRGEFLKFLVMDHLDKIN